MSPGPLRLASRRVLLEEGPIRPATVTVADGRIAEVTEGTIPGALELGELLLAPALVDIHGDAFERQLMPRPGVMIDIGVALEETDRQLAGCGIGTAFHGLSWSWEPGLRSVGTAHEVLDRLERGAPGFAAEHRCHVRFEAYNLEGLPSLLDAVAAGRIGLVAFNDHTPAMAQKAADPAGNIGNALRALMPLAEFNELAVARLELGSEVAAGTRRLAAACRGAGVPMLSHDDASPQVRRAFRALGATLCEFPTGRATAEEARAAGEHVIMGAPNVLRGRSHLGWHSAQDAVAAGLCDVLASDYYYPALLQAPFRLASRGVLPLAQAWRLVAANPAHAAGLRDRGRIAPGLLADLVAVDEAGGLAPRVLALWRAGRAVWQLGGVASRGT